MRLTSPAYADGTTMPARFATAHIPGGTNVSVPLSWQDVPPATRSFALVLIDTHPVANGWVHWLVTGIPRDVRGVPEGASHSSAMPFPALEHPNTWGDLGYGGPQPPAGTGAHDYVADLYALDVDKLDLARDARWDEVRAAMSGHVLGTAALVGRFGR